ncbi:hypothetical protein SAMN02745150_00662 [Brevinema andersonii]|uniref:Core-2/I-Branching enzyme n=1 Tax=Brevinema andersonii TaxID=34097 RepID=A0A1I1DPS8_BREAD|nr:hypothetical protein [Brevinema andersonii]SFB76436.1 hypothetical protein SAMN02745150_00662 [Brevinema andersonii]
MKNVWMVHAYQNFELVIHLINTIFKEDDTVWLHYDKKSLQKEFLFIQNTFKNNPNVFYIVIVK